MSILKGSVTINGNTMGASARQLASQAVAQGGTLPSQTQAQVAPQQPQVYNGTGFVPLAPKVNRPLTPLVFTLTNSGSSLLTFKFGDPTDAIDPSQYGVSAFSDPVFNNGIAYSSWKKSLFGSNWLSTQTVTYTTSSDSTQFNQRFLFANFNIFDGSNYGFTNVAGYIANQVRSTDLNTLTKNVDFNQYGVSPSFDIDSYLVIDVLAGETVTLIFTPLVNQK